MADSGISRQSQQFRLQAAQMEGEANMRSGETVRQTLTGVGDQYLRATQQGIENQFQQRQQQMQQQRLMMEDAANQAEIGVQELRRQKLQQDIAIGRQLQESTLYNEQIRTTKLQNDSLEIEIQQRRDRLGQPDARTLNTESLMYLLDYADSRGEIYDLFTGKLTKGTPDQVAGQKRMRETMSRNFALENQRGGGGSLMEMIEAARRSRGGQPDPSPAAAQPAAQTEVEMISRRLDTNVRPIFSRIVSKYPSVEPSAAERMTYIIGESFERKVQEFLRKNPDRQEWEARRVIQSALDESFDATVQSLMATPTKK